MLGGVQAQAFTLIETFCSQRLDRRALVAAAEPIIDLNLRLGSDVVIQTPLPTLSLAIQHLQARGGFGAYQLLTHLADLRRAGAFGLQACGVLPQFLLQLRQYGVLQLFRQGCAQAVDGNAFFLCAHCAVVLYGQALQGEAVVAFLTGEEGLVGFAVEQSCAQGLHGGLALAHGIQAGQLRQVALQQHQLTLVAQVLLQQCLRAGPCRFLQLAVDVVAQT